jgi:hypothetical protein
MEPITRTHAARETRRHRQVVEIAKLVTSGSCDRAEGLALVHAAEFPEDAALLARITGSQPIREAPT